MKSLIKYLIAIILCLSVTLLTSCADAEYTAVVYDTTPRVYIHPYPVYSYHYYAPRRMYYHRPSPLTPPRRPVITPRPQPKHHGNIHKQNNNRGHFGGRR